MSRYLGHTHLGSHVKLLILAGCFMGYIAGLGSSTSSNQVLFHVERARSLPSLFLTVKYGEQPKAGPYKGKTLSTSNSLKINMSHMKNKNSWKLLFLVLPFW